MSIQRRRGVGRANRPPVRSHGHLLLVAGALLLPLAPEARASFLSGEALDTAADIVAWAALVIVPVALIAAFWIVHILPEKIAKKRRHPQLAAIKTLCLLSLLFGGLLWPLAWLWAYTKPVLHKLAYGTDKDDHVEHDDALAPFHDARVEVPDDTPPAPAPVPADALAWQQRLDALDRRLAAIEASTGANAARPHGDGET